MSITPEQINNWFTYHPPTEPQRKAYEVIRNDARRLAREMAQQAAGPGAFAMVAETFRDVCPAGQDLVYALGVLQIAEDDYKRGNEEGAFAGLRTAIMWANAAIACAPPESVGIAEAEQSLPTSPHLARGISHDALLRGQGGL